MLGCWWSIKLVALIIWLRGIMVTFDTVFSHGRIQLGVGGGGTPFPLPSSTCFGVPQALQFLYLALITLKGVKHHFTPTFNNIL